MNLPPNWLKVLFRPGKALQAQELIQSQLIASKQIGLPFQYLIGQFRVIQGLGVTLHTSKQGRLVRVTPGRVAINQAGGWRVINIPPFELAYIDRLYIGLLITEATTNLEPDPALGGPVLGRLGNPLVRLNIQVTTLPSHGYPLAEVYKDRVYLYQDYLPGESQYDDLIRELRSRLYEELGDFIYQGFNPTNIGPQMVSISPGTAYINGHRVQTSSPQIVMLMGPKIYLTQSGVAVCPPTDSLNIKVAQVQVRGGLKLIHRVGLPLLIRVPIRDLEDLSTLPRLEICEASSLRDSKFRLPKSSEIYQIYQALLSKNFAQPDNSPTDDYHPLYTARVSEQGITLGRYEVKVNVDSYAPKHTQELYAWQGGLTEYNLCPDTKSPYLELKGQTFIGYNLPNLPLPLTCKGEPIAPVSIEHGLASGNIVTPARNHIRLTTPYNCLHPWLGPYGESSAPLLDNGFAQEFEASNPIQVIGFKFYTQNTFTGLVVLSSGQLALDWVSVFDQAGEVYVEFPMPVSVTGIFRVNLISNSKAMIGVYDINTNAPRSESVYSKRLLLSVDNNWVPVPNKDLACEIFIAKGTPNAEYEINIPVSHLEAFDGAIPNLSVLAPSNTFLSLTWYRNGEPLVDLNSFYPTNELTLSLKASLSPTGSLPLFLGGEVSLSITRKDSTWVGRDEETNKLYNQALLLLEYLQPEGTEVKPYLSSDGGRTWFGFDESNITKLTGDRYQAEFRAIDLPLSLLMTDVNGQSYPVSRTRGRVRIDLSTQQPHTRPIVYDVKVVYSYA